MNDFESRVQLEVEDRQVRGRRAGVANRDPCRFRRRTFERHADVRFAQVGGLLPQVVACVRVRRRRGNQGGERQGPLKRRIDDRFEELQIVELVVVAREPRLEPPGDLAGLLRATEQALSEFGWMN